MRCLGLLLFAAYPPPPRKVASLVAQMVKKVPATQETQVWTLGQEVPLEKEMATHSSNLAWEIPWPGDPGGIFDSPWFAKSRTRLSN